VDLCGAVRTTMADFARWSTACVTAIWPGGTFWSAYCGNRDEAVAGVIESDPVAAAVRSLMTAQTEWTGTASDLLGTLAERAGERVAKSKTWPDSPRALGGRLRRAATFLRKIGVNIGFSQEGRARTRIIRITAALSPAPDREEHQSSAPSASSAQSPGLNAANGFTRPDLRTVNNHADGRGNGGTQADRAKPLSNNEKDGEDDADANLLRRSTSGKTVWRARL
jgi:hypothetical protein